MVNITEIIVDVESPGGRPGINVFYFDSAVAIATQRLRLQQFYSDMFTSLTGGASYTIRNEGKVVDDATGVLQSVWSDSTSYTGGSSSTDEPVANASQILVRWSTADVVNGRLLKGRTYIPGCKASNLVDGELTGSYQSAVAGLANSLAESDANLLIWHRPTNSVGGEAHAVTAGTCWNELAVLRHRRG